MIESLVALAVFITLSFLASASGAFFRPGEWYYEQIRKPSWNPPSWLFPPVWTLLYIMMSVAAWLVWRETGVTGGLLPLGLFVVQLGLNALWSYLFFGRENLKAAFWEALLLFAAVFAMAVAFWEVRTLAGLLVVPYVLWVGFAAFLTYTIWRLNPDQP